ncbi:hypothetical protein OC846_000124 [Tilletia horrida]|uniref:EamA domain-containing protein n=1 Tax=Tilletia horrida TaxID=155126 RepID=A0AAN6GW30_9BASI|nr:hypothetical protein OC845_002367 [Tilletia horrida]KAK0557830.1 hypothetical protein OC846_000124 [Tilletia horrida]
MTDAYASSSGRRASSEYLTGILLLLLVVVLWTASNFLTNTVLTHGYDKPFAVTFANTSSFALYLIPFLCVPKRDHSRRRRRRSTSNSSEEEDDQDSRDPSASPSSSAWYVKLGFILPDRDRHPSDSSQHGPDPEERAGLLSQPQERPSHTHSQLGLPSAVTSGQDLSASVDSLRRPRSVLRTAATSETPSRPSSIDGRRPRGNLVHVSSFRELILSSDPTATVTVIDPNAEQTLHWPPLTLRQTAILAAQFTIVWFIANWSLNAGLGLTSVASGTTLSSASGFFTLGLGALFGVERFTFSKLGAVTISFIGVVLVTRADSVVATQLLPRDSSLHATAPINAPLGDFLAILSAFSYAIYVTLLKLKIASEDRVSMPLFFGFVGAINILFLWPFGVLLHLTGVETFQWPSDRLTWAGVFVNMAITFISDFAYLLAMLKSSPLVATVGLSLTIPLALAGDVLRGSHSGGWLGSVGSIMVLFSFVAIGFADLETEPKKEQDEADGRQHRDPREEGDQPRTSSSLSIDR